MVELIVILLSFYGLTFTIKDSDIFNKPRLFLIKLHPFFFGLLDCYFCCGFWSGLIVYLIYNQVSNYNGFMMFLWGLTSASTSLIINGLVERIYRNE